MPPLVVVSVHTPTTPSVRPNVDHAFEALERRSKTTTAQQSRTGSPKTVTSPT